MSNQSPLFEYRNMMEHIRELAIAKLPKVSQYIDPRLVTFFTNFLTLEEVVCEIHEAIDTKTDRNSTYPVKVGFHATQAGFVHIEALYGRLVEEVIRQRIVPLADEERKPGEKINYNQFVSLRFSYDGITMHNHNRRIFLETVPLTPTSREQFYLILNRLTEEYLAERHQYNVDNV